MDWGAGQTEKVKIFDGTADKEYKKAKFILYGGKVSAYVSDRHED